MYLLLVARLYQCHPLKQLDGNTPNLLFFMLFHTNKINCSAVNYTNQPNRPIRDLRDHYVLVKIVKFVNELLQNVVGLEQVKLKFNTYMTTFLVSSTSIIDTSFIHTNYCIQKGTHFSREWKTEDQQRSSKGTMVILVTTHANHHARTIIKHCLVCQQ